MVCRYFVCTQVSHLLSEPQDLPAKLQEDVVGRLRKLASQAPPGMAGQRSPPQRRLTLLTLLRLRGQKGLEPDQRLSCRQTWNAAGKKPMDFFVYELGGMQGPPSTAASDAASERASDAAASGGGGASGRFF